MGEAPNITNWKRTNKKWNPNLSHPVFKALPEIENIIDDESVPVYVREKMIREVIKKFILSTGLKVTRVWLDESENVCVSCGECEKICPRIFKTGNKMKVRPVRLNHSEVERILDAANSCPIGVIAIEINNSGKRDNEI